MAAGAVLCQIGQHIHQTKGLVAVYPNLNIPQKVSANPKPPQSLTYEWTYPKTGI